jgi:hypothetical protein
MDTAGRYNGYSNIRIILLNIMLLYSLSSMCSIRNYSSYNFFGVLQRGRKICR